MNVECGQAAIRQVYHSIIVWFYGQKKKPCSLLTFQHVFINVITATWALFFLQVIAWIILFIFGLVYFGVIAIAISDPWKPAAYVVDNSISRSFRIHSSCMPVYLFSDCRAGVYCPHGDTCDCHTHKPGWRKRQVADWEQSPSSCLRQNETWACYREWVLQSMWDIRVSFNV